MIHVKQKAGLGTCGAVAYASILHLSELQGIRECRTKMIGRGSGTSHGNVVKAFAKRGIQSYFIDSNLRLKISEAFWLGPLSSHFPLYVSVSERSNGSTHAVVVANNLVYDGHNDGPVPLEMYGKRRLEHMIVVDQELPTYAKNNLTTN